MASAAWQVIGFRVIDRVGKGLRTPPRDALIAEVTPLPLRGRAFALYNAARNGAELGALALAGVLISAIGAQAALLLSGVIPLAIGVIALVFITTPHRRPAHAYDA